MTPAELQITMDRRADRAAMAAATSRRNMPATLLVLALLLLFVSVLTVLWAWNAAESATAQVAARAYQAQAIQDTAAEIKAIRQKLKDVKDARSNAPIPGMALKLKEACPSDRLREVLGSQSVNPTRGATEGSNVLQRIQYNNLQHDNIGDVLAWIESARAQIPALEVDRLNLKPGPNTWTFSITFMRWEKKEGT